MIQDITVLNAEYANLQTYFPKGHQLETDDSIVMVVGPNGAGKTALLRLISTSLESARFYDHHGISRTWESTYLDRALSQLGKNPPRKLDEDWYANEGVDISYANPDLGIRNTISPSLRHDLNDIAKLLFNDARFSISEQDLDKLYGGEKISAHAFDQIMEAKGTLRKDTDQNRWVHIKPTVSPGGPVFFQEHLLSEYDWSHRGSRNNKSRFLSFHPTYETTSPGATTLSNLQESIDTIKRFFDKRSNPIFKYEVCQYDFDHVMQALAYKQDKSTQEEVSADARLVVFMDEPTATLDYKNTLDFREKIEELTHKYSGRIQFFITTNDASLIEKMDGTIISLYDTPAKNLASFEELF